MFISIRERKAQNNILFPFHNSVWIQTAKRQEEKSFDRDLGRWSENMPEKAKTKNESGKLL